MGVAQFCRRAGLRSRLLEVQVLSPTSDFRRRSSIGRARVCQARGREFKPPRRFHILCTLGRVDSGAGPQPLSGRFDSVSVLQFDLPKWRNLADARSLNLRHLKVRVPPSALSVLRVGKCSVRSHKPRLAGSVTQTRNQNMGRWASPVKPSVFQAEDRGFESCTPCCV